MKSSMGTKAVLLSLAALFLIPVASHAQDESCCNGKVDELTLQNLGNEGWVEVYRDCKNTDEGECVDGKVFDDNVGQNDTFSFSHTPHLGTNISIFVDNVHNTVMHTSCSADTVGIGSIKGDFLVVDGGSVHLTVPLCDCDVEWNPSCDDAVDCTDDYCDEDTASCENWTNDDYCDDELWCTGVETCDAVNDCQDGADPCTPPLVCDETNNECVDCLVDADCDDGVSCTVDTCNSGTCSNTPNDSLCDNGLYCDGTETCDAVDDCQPGAGDPCTPELMCDETNDKCVGCLGDADCDDGISCTVDTCVSGSCSNTPNDSLCDDGLWCNGSETCDPALDCQAGTAPDCDDGVGCTDDSCDDVNNQCVSQPNDGNCDDGLWCNGSETCHVINDCQAGTPVVCDDGVGCTVDSCNEGTDSCDNVPDDGACDNGLYCDGSEVCDPVNDCQDGDDPCAPPLLCDETNDTCTGCIVDDDCDDGVACTVDTCDSGTCSNTPDDSACDDGLWCSGAETCDAVNDCQAGTPVDCNDGNDCTDDTCNEETDSCENPCNATSSDDLCCDDGACWAEVVCAGECIDLDGDGWGNPANISCPVPYLDCEDDPSNDGSCPAGTCVPDCVCGAPDCACCARCVHPTALDFPEDGVDTDCDPATPPIWDTPTASTFREESGLPSEAVNHIFFVLAPMAVVLLWKRRRT